MLIYFSHCLLTSFLVCSFAEDFRLSLQQELSEYSQSSLELAATVPCRKVIPTFPTFIPKIIHTHIGLFCLVFCYFYLVIPTFPQSVDKVFLYLYSLLCCVLAAQDNFCQSYELQHFVLLSSVLMGYVLFWYPRLLTGNFLLFFCWFSAWVIHKLTRLPYLGDGDWLFGCLLSLFWPLTAFFHSLFIASSLALATVVLDYWAQPLNIPTTRALSLPFLPFLCAGSLVALLA